MVKRCNTTGTKFCWTPPLRTIYCTTVDISIERVMAEIRIRDSVHGFMSFGDKERDLIDSIPLQRLRGIRQLAMASLVYPGAVHTRFDHTLGVAHLAGLMAEALDLDKDERRLVRFAALLHDVGHGPFSHVSETALERFAVRQALPEGQKNEKIHERVTADIIRQNPRLQEIIGRDDCEHIARLLSIGHGDPVLKAVISGPLDADKQDYLLRDSHFCGVSYGLFDSGQFFRSLVCNSTNNGRDLMVARDGVHAVEQYVLAKYHMTAMVYRHKVRLITDQMITRAIVLGVERDNIADLRSIYAYDGSSAFLDNYVQWDDARFIDTFSRGANASSRCGRMLERLRNRQLLKRVFRLSVKELAPEAREYALNIIKAKYAAIRSQTEAEVAEQLAIEFKTSVDAGDVIVHSYAIRSAREMSRNDEAAVIVATPGQNVRTLEQESTLFASIDERLSDQYIEVYAPMEWKNHAEREQRLTHLVSTIKPILERHLSRVAKEVR